MFTEKNIPRLTLIIPIVAVTTLVGIIIAFFIHTRDALIEDEIQDLQKRELIYYQDILKERIIHTEEHISFLYNIKKFSKERIINEMAFQDDYIFNNEDNSSYLSIVEPIGPITDLKFKVIVNRNIQAKTIDANFKDLRGKSFMRDAVNQILEDGDAFVTYTFRKPEITKESEKLSYYKLYPQFNWIISQGVYLDDIAEKITQREEELRQRITDSSYTYLGIVLGTALGVIILSSILSFKVRLQFERYGRTVEEKNKNLKLLNEKLESDVEKKTKQLLTQSRNAAMSEMISMVAHQWRQPLNVISLSLFTVDEALADLEVDDPFVKKQLNKSIDKIGYLSDLINDFSNLFRQDTTRTLTNIDVTIEKCIDIIENTFGKDNVKFYVNSEVHEATLYKSEYQQIIVALLKNAIEAVEDSKILHPQITIETTKEQKFFLTTIIDNAGGIQQEILESIFEPYTSTKGKNGYGVGLFMVKEIVEKHMQGSISISNIQQGAKVVIKIPV